MSLRLEMLQVARLAPKLLGDSAELVRDFALDRLCDNGAFKNRDDAPDLYYTVFGLDCLNALQIDPPVGRVRPYLETFDTGAIRDLDLVHLACLVHCWSALPDTELPEESRALVVDRLASLRCNDGGFSNLPGDQRDGTVYGCFLALGTYLNLDVPFPDAARSVAFVESMRTADGAYANDRLLDVGTTPATAAAVGFLRNVRAPVPAGVREWLAARAYPDGGFLAMPTAPMPDLLSTAVALHALGGLEHPIDDFREYCLDFIDSLWTSSGGFYGNWAETDLDLEYTFYGLLALGHLSV